MADANAPGPRNVGVWLNQGVVLQITQALRVATRLADPPVKTIPRADLVDRIAGVFEGRESSVALSSVLASGDGGQGKSVLATLYAHKHAHKYPKGRLFLNCGGGRTLVELFAPLLPSDIGIELSLPERASLIRSVLCQEPGFLIVFDNVESIEHWERLAGERADPGDLNTGLMPGSPCHVIVTCREAIPTLEGISVDRLNDDECRDLLKRFGIVPQGEAEEEAFQTIVRETEGVAFLVAAVGASLAQSGVSLPDYAAWLSARPIEELPTDGRSRYEGRIESILDDMLSRLHPAERRCLEYAAWLPQDAIRPEWLEILLDMDGIDGGHDAIGRPKPFKAVVERLKTLNLLREMSTARLSVHRLLAKRLRETVEAEPTIAVVIERLTNILNHFGVQQGTQGYPGRAQACFGDCVLIQETLSRLLPSSNPRRNDLAGSYMNQGVTYRNLGDLPAALEDYGKAVELMEALRRELEPIGQWTHALRNDLAAAYANRGNAQTGLGQLSAAVDDYGKAIELREALRRELEPTGQWSPALRNALAVAHTNRGVAHVDLGHLPAGLEDYGKAIELREVLRRELEPIGQWTHALRNDLAAAYANRGNAQTGLGQLSAAVDDYGKAIELREALRRELEPTGQWSPALRNALAVAHMNRGNAHAESGELSVALEDYGKAVELMEALRRELEPAGQWPPALRNDLAASYANLGNAHTESGDLPTALEDYGKAVELMEALRRELEPAGQWPPAQRNFLAAVHMNRGNLHRKIGDLPVALEDYGKAIELMRALRRELEPAGQWPPALRNDLAAVHMNRGAAHADLDDLLAALEDYGKAVELMEALRRELEPAGQWPPALRIDIAKVYLNRAVALDRLGKTESANEDRKSVQAISGLRFPDSSQTAS